MTYPDKGRWEPGPNFLKEMGYSNNSRFKRTIFHPNKPKRPTTGYDVFFRNTYPHLKRDQPAMTQQQLFSHIGRLWRENTTWQDRQICYDFADEEKDTYYAEMKEWRKKREKMQDYDRVILAKEVERKAQGKPGRTRRNEMESDDDDEPDELNEPIKWQDDEECRVQ